MGDEKNLEELGKDPSSSEGQKKEGEGEQLILGRFKSQDDLVKSYKELETKFTQGSQEAADLKRMIQELQVRVPQQQKEEQVDLDTVYWEKPSKLREDLLNDVRKLLEPLAMTQFQVEKTHLKSDPMFVKYEAEIDQLIGQLPPQLKSQPGMLGELFTLVKGRHQNEILEDERKRIRKEIEEGREGAIFGSLEEPSGGEHLSNKTRLPSLTDEEKRVAEQFNPELSKADAHKKYAEKKVKLEKEDRERMGR
jgi:hypothetical protein